MLSAMYGSFYLQGRQFGLCLVSQRSLGKLSSFYSFYALSLHYIAPIMIMLLSDFFLSLSFYFISQILYIFLPVIILFYFIFYALPLEVKPLNNSQTVTDQHINIYVDVGQSESSLCKYGQVEDTEHFILQCPFKEEPRSILARNLGLTC